MKDKQTNQESKMTNEENSIIGSVKSPTSTNNIAELGRLRSVITVELHTYEATVLLNGKKRSDDVDGIGENEKRQRYTPHNLTMLAQAMMLMEGDIRRDNPFADYWFDSIWTRVTELRDSINGRKEHLKNYMGDKLPKSFSTSHAFSVKPVVFAIRSGSVLYYQFLYAVLEIDEYLRMVMLASHIGIITPQAKRSYIQDVMSSCRSAISSAASYRHFEVTRDDMAANNHRAIKATEHYSAIGITPTEAHMRGETRNEMAPEIYTHQQRNQTDVSQAYADSESNITEVAEEVA